MSAIRPFEREDLAPVTALYEQVARSGARTPPPGLAPYFERTLLDHPWVDPDIPSLVYEDDGRIVGFIASHVRRMVFDGRPIRLACSGQLVADPEARNRAVGALLMRKYLAGPQELTITDGPTELVRQIWGRLGGTTTDLTSLRWVKVFRPWRYGGDELLRKLHAESLQPLLRPLWWMLDAVTTRVADGVLRPGPTDTSGEPLTPEALVEHLPKLGADVRLRPDYDTAYASWVLGELERVSTRGRLVRTLVKSGDKVLGWYVYYVKPGEIADVVQIVAADGGFEPVLKHLFRDAHGRGAVALQGRMEPRMVEPLLLQNCIPAPCRWTLIHSRDPEILGTATSRQSMLTRLEGEWWMGHHTESFA